MCEYSNEAWEANMGGEDEEVRKEVGLFRRGSCGCRQLLLLLLLVLRLGNERRTIKMLSWQGRWCTWGLPNGLGLHVHICGSDLINESTTLVRGQVNELALHH